MGVQEVKEAYEYKDLVHHIKCLLESKVASFTLCGWVYIFIFVPLANPMAVIPSSSASFSAKSVGAALEINTPMPILETFNKTSDDIRPLNTIILSRTGILLTSV